MLMCVLSGCALDDARTARTAQRSLSDGQRLTSRRVSAHLISTALSAILTY
jgi:hypothetical protein